MSTKENNLYKVEESLPKAHLIGICPPREEELRQKSMQELELLVKTMGLETASRNLQKRDHPDKALFTGSGFIEEVVAGMEDGDILIFDNDLQPAQVRNINQKFGVDILDRTEVILEIFQQHARSSEARIQVELASYEYELPRLRNLWKHLDRERGTASTGGISRGGGEKQIELDRRYVRQKIKKARKDLKKIASAKEMQRQYRFAHFKKVCVVGYTNAGKSTLFNALTDSKVLVEDKLFATLESTSRALDLGKGKDVILSDTVGFISQLPHHLVASFRATLQEVNDADLLLHVIDAADPDFTRHIRDVNTVLAEIDCDQIPMLLVFNKIDLLSEDEITDLKAAFPQALLVSALKQNGLNFLLENVDDKLNIAHRVCFLIPHDEQKAISRMFELGEIINKRYENKGVFFEVIINDEDLFKFEKWKVLCEKKEIIC